MRRFLSALLLLATSPVAASEPAVVTATPITRTAATAIGQPIVLPSMDVEIVVSTYERPTGAKLPEHRHPYPRHEYLMEGA